MQKTQPGSAVDPLFKPTTLLTFELATPGEEQLPQREKDDPTPFTFEELFGMRLAERDLLTGYEVQSGKSILYFKRHARGMSNKDLDVFRGIAAPDRNMRGKKSAMPTVWAARAVGARLAIR